MQLENTRLRNHLLDIDAGTISISVIEGSSQYKDLKLPPNCKGLGRIRHFKRFHGDWVDDPLPIDPACRALGLPKCDSIQAQLFQVSGCNLNCWYCFVPRCMRVINSIRSRQITAQDLIFIYLEEENRRPVIDLSGGDPGLVPEWLYWMMKALEERDIHNETYLWVDDNLTNEYFFSVLTSQQIDYMLSYKNHGRVGCLKGFDQESFTFNTNADRSLYDRQFEILKKYVSLGFDTYAYVTLTTINTSNLESKIKYLFDRLQNIDEQLPSRTVPLEIVLYSANAESVFSHHKKAMENQWLALEYWKQELSTRMKSITR